jgi:hypothetical protein
MRKILGMMLLMVGASALVFSQDSTISKLHKAPEIGATAAGSGLALITGTLLVLRGRRKKQ